jgi:hypothetical protein
LGLNWRGPWNANVIYQVGDGVSYYGTSYIAVLGGLNEQEPDLTSEVQSANPTWNTLAAGVSANTLSIIGTDTNSATQSANSAQTAAASAIQNAQGANFAANLASGSAASATASQNAASAAAVSASSQAAAAASSATSAYNSNNSIQTVAAQVANFSNSAQNYASEATYSASQAAASATAAAASAASITSTPSTGYLYSMPANQTFDVNGETMATLNLPQGNYIVTAAFTMFGSNSQGSGLCWIDTPGFGNEFGGFTEVFGQYNSVIIVQASHGGQSVLTCSMVSSGTTGNIFRGALSAVSVGTLTLTP